MSRLKFFLSRFGLDLALLAPAVVCFVLYGYRASSETEGAEPPLAWIASGSGERKASGAAFVTVGEGTALHDLDVLWVPPGGSAKLVFENRAEALLSERTLLVVKRPFTGKGKAKDRVIALAGRVIIREGGRSEPVPSDPGLRILRKEEDSTVFPSGSKDSDYTPGSGTLVLSKSSGRARVQFRWPPFGVGYLMLTDGTSPGTMHHRVREGVAEASVSLKTGARYRWSLMSATGSVLAGPFPFSLEDYDDKRVKEALMKGGDAARIQVLSE